MQHLKQTPLPVPRRHPLQARRHQRGMTLIEWMVSITVGLILLVGLSALIAQQSSTQAELEKSSRQIENGRYAMRLLQDDIELAGYFGEYAGAGELSLPNSLPNPCLVAATALTNALPFPIQGYDSPGASLPAAFSDCPLNAANHVDGSDILVVRRVEPATVTGLLTIGQPYLQSGLSASGSEFLSVLATAAGTAVDVAVFNLKKKDGTTTASLRKYLVHIYFLSPCSVPANGSTCSAANTDDGGVSVPTLKRLELLDAGMTTVPLVEGIDKMQIDYGFDTTGDGAPDSYAKDAAPFAAWDPATVADPKPIAHWGNVMTVRIHLLARNNERSGGYQDTKTYNLGLDGTTAASNDGFKRRVFSQLVRVVNISSRRDGS
ncbi:PilW family protein [Polaromonas sp.]|jgi:type IV pilus assembly protein PilW|uniref:PilW family protein n=1 Tax=Polaromonas sp. TaxID=1869339 RepID=UPI001E0B1E68|nr:PilW family protein [Polaromonas sp.]MBT9476478.1 PilW family protein [Polaromonas sp.]